MAIPLVAGTLVEDTLRLSLSDTDSANYEFGESDLTRLLARAMDRYNRMVPYRKQYTFSVVANQSDYALPADCVSPVECDWRPYPGLTGTPIVAYLNTLYGTAEILPSKLWSDEPANRIREQYAIRFEGIGAGTFRTIDYATSYSPTQYIRLSPTPTQDGATVNVLYLSRHPMQNNNYFTVPVDHVDAVVKLCLAECYEVRLARIVSTANVNRVGTTDIRFESKGLAELTRELRQAVQDQLGGASGVYG